ncbi:MAG: hypothetical protein KDJ14_02200 [Xanthomonadales bacterium]|nr:hypothetical protein [Xanthomonadales bacterium]
MSTAHAHPAARFVHIVTLDCKDPEHALRCIQMLTQVGLPDAKMFQCVSYEYGLEVGSTERIVLIERWQRWEDLDALIEQCIAPDLDKYNSLLKQPFDVIRDTRRVELGRM